MSNFFITIAVFLITIIGALFAIPYFIDWNGYRGVFEEEATRLLGREVRVGGAVNLHLLPTPYFRFEKVRIADTSVNLQEPFFRTDSLTIKLAIPPMFRGVVEANEIELQRPVLRFALDKDDGWNWQSFGQAFGQAAYLPSKIALTSVKIADGALALHAPDGAERTRFDGLNGEFSAPALEGPYRFRGTFGRARAERELRIATARPEPDGSVRFKATLRVGDGASTYALDGRLADLTGKPRIDGELTARLPIASLWHAPQRGNVRAQRLETGTQPQARLDRGEPAFDLKAAVNISPAGATLSDLALAFEQNGRPQLITGELKALWREALAVEMSLSSRWLDLDRMAGAAEGAGPLESIIPLAIAMRDLLPAEGRSRASFAIDQGNVGREAVSNLRLSLARSQDKLEIEELRLGMPGGSRGELRGVVSGPPEAPTFDGSLSLRGTSVIRFFGWATGNALSFDAKGDGTFGFRSQISIAPGQMAARNVIGDLSGTTIRGDARYRWEGRPELSLLIESPQLDARAFIPAGSSLGDIFDLILHGPATRQSSSARDLGTAKPGWRSAQTDALVRVNTGQLITASRTYRDVMMEIELRGGRLKLPLLRVAGDDGFSLELEGDVDNAATHPKGILRGVIGAETAQAIAPLADLLGIPDAFRPSARRAQAMVPLRVAGSMTLGARTPTSADMVLDGELNGAGMKVNARFDGGPAGWRTGPVDLTGLVEGADAGTIAALLAPGSSAIRGGNPGPGRLLVKASGVPAQGLASLASVDAGGLGLSFRGQLVAAESGNSAAGDLEIKATDGTRVAALAGLAPPLRLDGVPVTGSLKLTVDASRLEIDRLGLKVAGGDVRGQILLVSAGDRRRVEARLDVDELSVPRLLGPLLDQRLAPAGAAETAISGRQSPWPDEPFDATVLDGFEGSIRLNSKRLLLADGIGLGQAGIDIALEGGKIDVKRIEGTCLGGRCSASLRIDKVPAGVEISGDLRVVGGTLQAVAAGAAGGPRASGTIGGEIKFAGKGTSPRNVLSVLQGGGTLELGEAKLATLWPGAIAVAAEAALRAEPDKLAAVLKQALVAGFAGGRLPLPGMVKLKIADGQLGVKPFTIDTAEGRAQGGVSLDLRTLAIDSEWRLDQKPAGPADKPALPTVTVTYRGPIASLGGLEPRIASEALERELVVRRMERDVEELERLRRLDETRRREEAERQRRQFEQTPVPVPVAPAPPQPRPATPG
jgi:uncharacterized protein involved in outer membrane biogenesis